MSAVAIPPIDKRYQEKPAREVQIRKVNDCLQYATMARSLLDKKRIRWWKNYHSVNDPILKKKDQTEIKTLSNIFMPFTLGFVEQRIPRILGKMPSLSVYGEDQEFDPEWTDSVQQMLRTDLERAGYFLSSIIHIKQAEIFGWSVRSNFWRYEKGRRLVRKPITVPLTGTNIGFTRQEEEYVQYDDPWTEVVDIFRCYPQPGALSIERSDWFIHEAIVSRRELFLAAKAGRYDADQVLDLVRNSPGVIAGQSTGISGNTIADNPYWQKLQAIGLYNANPDWTGADHFPRHRLITMWTNEEVCTVADDRWLIRCRRNPYQRKPFTEYKVIPIPFMLEGIGCVQMLEQLQKAINIQENQRIDAINMGINPVVLAPEGVTVDWDNFIMSPGRKVSCSDPTRLEWFKAPPPGPDSYQQSRILQDTAKWLTAINDYVNPSQGEIQGEAGRTFRGIAAIQQQSNLVFNQMAELFDIQDVTPTSKWFYQMRQQFQDRPRTMRVLGRKGYNYVKVLPKDLDYSPDIRAVSGSALPQDKAEERERATVVMQSFFGNPLGMQLGMDQREIAMEFLRGIGYRNPEKFWTQASGDVLQTIAKEHEALAFGQPVPPSGDPQLHLVLHQLFIQSPLFQRIPEENRQLFQDHLEAHLAKLEQTPKSKWFERQNLPEAIDASNTPATHGA